MGVPPLRSRAVILVGLAGPVLGCTSGMVNPQIPPPGSLAFQDGYLAGCPSGFTDAGRDGYQQDYRKDAARYAGDTDYRLGWDQGHGACYEEEKRHPKIIGGNGGREHPRSGSTGSTSGRSGGIRGGEGGGGSGGGGGGGAGH